MSRLEVLPASMATAIVRFKAPSPDPHLQLELERKSGAKFLPSWGGP